MSDRLITSGITLDLRPTAVVIIDGLPYEVVCGKPAYQPVPETSVLKIQKGSPGALRILKRIDELLAAVERPPVEDLCEGILIHNIRKTRDLSLTFKQARKALMEEKNLHPDSNPADLYRWEKGLAIAWWRLHNILSGSPAPSM